MIYPQTFDVIVVGGGQRGPACGRAAAVHVVQHVQLPAAFVQAHALPELEAGSRIPPLDQQTAMRQ